MNIVWSIICEDLPVLKKQIIGIKTALEKN